MWNVAIKMALKGEAEMKYNITNKRKTYKDIDYNSLQRFRPLGSRVTPKPFICHVTRLTD